VVYTNTVMLERALRTKRKSTPLYGGYLLSILQYVGREEVAQMSAYEIISILINAGMLLVSLLAFLDMRKKNKSKDD
jgi:hypothetical protein